jgi:hypothetical protein
VSGPASCSISRLFPTATIRSPYTAIACAEGLVGSNVTMLPFRKMCVGCRHEVTELEVFLLFLFPCCEDLLDLLRPLNFSAAILTVFGLEKNFVMTVFAEESLLLRFVRFCDVGDPHDSLCVGCYQEICCFTPSWTQKYRC